MEVSLILVVEYLFLLVAVAMLAVTLEDIRRGYTTKERSPPPPGIPVPARKKKGVFYG